MFSIVGGGVDLAFVDKRRETVALRVIICLLFSLEGCLIVGEEWLPVIKESWEALNGVLRRKGFSMTKNVTKEYIERIILTCVRRNARFGIRFHSSKARAGLPINHVGFRIA